MKDRVFVFIMALLLLTVTGCGTAEQSPVSVPEETPEFTEPSPIPDAPAKQISTPVPEQTEPASAPEPTPELLPERTYVFSFAGDCTLGSLVEWQGRMSGDFQSVVGENYAYPFSGVAELFQNDDFTMINLEGPLSEGGTPRPKKYRFRGNPDYTGILTSGSVEAVSLANNHALDLGEEGKNDTVDVLNTAGVAYADAGTPLITELEGGLRIGIVAFNTVESLDRLQVWKDAVLQDVETCREAGCHTVIGFMHWGLMEYRTVPDAQVVELAHAMADGGCDLIVGGHAHILQPVEDYNGVPIAYSMGNFCFGGNISPEDSDSVIIQAEYRYDPNSETAELTAFRAVPCQISSTQGRNDYCPRICNAEEDMTDRILDKLNFPGGNWKYGNNE